ncbi:MAG: hypothetical protein DRK00_00180 [Thermoprotei archaeon]|nr:MAG: hypothetical protein DRK00_00180 [Thermoprotei archaeon]
MGEELEFIKLLCERASERGLLEPLGRRTCPQHVAALIGYEWIRVIQHHALRLGLVVRGRAGLRLTSCGVEYADALLELAYVLRCEVGWGVRAIAAALEALTDWRAELRNGEEAVGYAKLVIRELEELKRIPGAYEWARSLIARYDFKHMESPIELLRKIKDLTLKSERAP